MYLTVKETADYLDLPEDYVISLVRQNKIRSVDDGDNTLINKDQFSTYLEQMEKYRMIIQEYLSEPIPEDPDVKDED